MVSQGMLFSEPSISETGVWCSLSEGIDPTEWATLCRHIGDLSQEEFRRVRRKIMFCSDIVSKKIKSESCCTRVAVKIPLVSIGPSGIGGRYQNENIDIL